MSALANWYPGHSVLDFCVIAAATVILVTATAWMVSLFLKRHPAIRHWVLLSALVASLASPFLALGFIASGRSFINVPLLIAEDTALAPEFPDEVNPSRNMQAERGHTRFLNEPAPSVAPETFLPTHRTGPAKAEAVRDNVATAGPKSPTVDPATGYSRQANTEPSDPFRSAVVAVLLMWLCGTLVVILGLFRGALFLRRLRQSVGPITDAELGKALDEARRLVGARSSPAIGVSSLARSPMVAGLFRPIIVIPRNLPGAIRGHQLRDILMHEIAHVERRDNLVVLLQAIAKAAFWPIPFLHLLNRELERAREEICDNHVLACRDAVSYGETLLRVAHLACETGMPVGTVGVLHWRGKLEDRIFGLIHKRRSKMTRIHPLFAGAVTILFLTTSVVLCGTTIIAAQTTQTATAGDDRVTESSDDDSRKAQDKSDQPPAAEAPVKAPQKQEKEKEAFTAWGNEVGGLQAGLGFRPGEKRAYSYGETVQVVLRVRNVGKEAVEFKHIWAFFVENPPTITNTDGRLVQLRGPEAQGVHGPRSTNVGPGKEVELYEWEFNLRPKGEGSKKEWATIHGVGKFSFQCERVVGPTLSNPNHPNPALGKLATGKLELEVKDAMKLPEKPDQEKEGVTAWGNEVGGLQAGLGFRPGEKRAYHHGETLTLVVWVRNVGKEPIKFEYLRQFFIEKPPTVTDGKDELKQLGKITAYGIHIPVGVNLAAGKEIELYELKHYLGSGNEEGMPKYPYIFGTGKFQVQYEKVLGNSSSGTIKIDPALDKLATGKLELEVKEPEKLSQDAKLVDRVPTDDVARLIAGVAAGRVRFDDFRAVVIHNRRGVWWRRLTPEIIHRKGNRIRRDLGFVGGEPVEPVGDVDRTAWWSKLAEEGRYRLASIVTAGVEQTFSDRTITEPDGSQRYEILPRRPTQLGLDPEEWIPSFYTLTPEYAGRPPLGLPNQHMEAIVEPDPGDGPEGTVLLRVRHKGHGNSSSNPNASRRPVSPGGRLYWIDPAREYLVMRWDMQGSSYIVEAVAQSPKGHWYPTRIRRTSSDPSVVDAFTDFYVEFDVEIPDALFDVKQPMPGEKLFHKSP